MSTHQRVWFGVLVLACLVLAVELSVLLPDASRRRPIYRQAAYQHIQTGMTYDEVQQLLGQSRGSIPEGRIMVASNIGPRPGCWGSTWFGSDMVVQVWFAEEDNRVTGKEYRPVIALPQDSLATKLRRWLKL